MINPQAQAHILTLIDNSTAEFISGHDLRVALLAQGFNKKEIGFSLGELVNTSQLERVKITDPEGLFYMAYRRPRH